MARTISNCQQNIMKSIGKLLTQAVSTIQPTLAPTGAYRPTPYLTHPFLQSVYNITEPLHPSNFHRERIFFEDGGHISLDWLTGSQPSANAPILFMMHGLTGGSDMNYIKELLIPASEQGYRSVCMNSRGINNPMTSPMPFTGLSFTELETALGTISERHPASPIYLVGASFGGNYLLRYLIRKKPALSNIKGLVVLAPPINVGKVVSDMGPVYQKFFVKRYCEETVFKHGQMKYWEEVGLVDMKEVRASQSLSDFHSSLTAKITGHENANEIFDELSLKPDEMTQLNLPTFMMVSKDDPIVSYASMPFQQLEANPNVTLQATQKGGHLCWFEGLKPKRWYPKPVLKFLKTLHATHL